MIKGEVVYCVTKDMPSFTYGKAYILLRDVNLNSSLIEVINDFDEVSVPTLYYTEKKEIKYYFISRLEWRNRFIKKLLNK
jgi:hypothetical protein